MDSNEIINAAPVIAKYLKIFTTNTLPADPYRKKVIKLDEVKELLDKLEEFVHSASILNVPRNQVISKLAELIVGFGLVKKFKDDQDYSREDFSGLPEEASTCFEFLTRLLGEVKLLKGSHMRHFLSNALLLVATHYEAYPWSSDVSISSSKEFLKNLLQQTGHSNLSSLLYDDTFHPSIFKTVLKKMRHSLEKDSWMLYPSSCYVFYWFLCHIKHPHLAEYLPHIFPPPLMFVSYHGVPQKAVGIKCFNHLLDNVPPTLIKMDNKGDVILDALHSLTYDKHVEIIEELFPCILRLPMMKENNENLVEWSDYDKIFNHMLVNLEMECNVEVKKILLSHTLAFVELRPPFKHLKLIKSILKRNLISYLFPDKICQIISLKILQNVIKFCWPRMEHHCFDILVLILELLEHDSLDIFDERYQLCEDCLLLLKRSCEEKFLSLTATIINDPDMASVALLKKVIHEQC